MYIYIYICNQENNVLFWLSPQWLCGNATHTLQSCDKRMSCQKIKVI